MKVYLIVVVDSYNLECATNKCFASREKAKKYCEKNNVYTYNYLQKCVEENEEPGNYTLFKVKEIEVIEDAR